MTAYVSLRGKENLRHYRFEGEYTYKRKRNLEGFILDSQGNVFPGKFLNFVFILYFSSIRVELGIGVLKEEIRFLRVYRESLISEASLDVMMCGVPIVFV